MQNFYMTFGVQYNHEPHPTWDGATGQGWVKVVAENYDDARSMVETRFGQAWSFLYPEEHFTEKSRSYYPMGEILSIGG